MAITGRIVPNTAHPDPGLGTEAKPWPVLHVTEIHSPALDGFVDDKDPRLSDARTPLSHAHEITDVTGLSDALGDKADAASLGGAALLDVGTTEGTVASGNDSRLSDARTPLSHGHAAGDISGLGDAATKNVGTTAGTVAAGDDARLSDTRDPNAHTHAQSDITNLATDLAGKMSVPTAVTELPETPTTGVIYARFADDEDDGHYYYTGTAWMQL